MEKIVEWLKQHWFLITAFVSVTTVWAADHQKIQTLEDAIKQQNDIQTELAKLQSQVARTDERTLMIIQLLEQQNRIIERGQNKTQIRSK
jgi:hypothetical protein